MTREKTCVKLPEFLQKYYAGFTKTFTFENGNHA